MYKLNERTAVAQALMLFVGMVDFNWSSHYWPSTHKRRRQAICKTKELRRRNSMTWETFMRNKKTLGVRFCADELWREWHITFRCHIQVTYQNVLLFMLKFIKIKISSIMVFFWCSIYTNYFTNTNTFHCRLLEFAVTYICFICVVPFHFLKEFRWLIFTNVACRLCHV